MGTVYLGKDVTLNRVVAVKVLKPELVSDHKFMATFLREAEITASLNHPNIVQVYAFGQHEGVYYLVVEYISGGTLDDKIMTLGRVTELEGIEIGLAVARGLECAALRGLIHRDIKPGNILFNANNTPKVVDFGLSLSFETTDHFDGEIWGTPYYVAPEKLERKPEDFRSDLYSLGATLFHAISGRPPYEGEDPNDVAMKHLSGKVVSLKAFVPDISDQVSYAVSKAMARNPDDRYESYAAFIEQLEDGKRRITDPNFRSMQHRDVAILETESSAKFNLWLIIGLIAVVVGLIGLFVWEGSSLFKNDETKAAADLNGYNPTGHTPALAPSAVTPPKSTPKPTPEPKPTPTLEPTPTPMPIQAVENAVPVGGTLIEAESGTFTGGAGARNDKAASGGQYVGNMGGVGCSVTFSKVPAASSITLKYATLGDSPFSLYINGQKIQELPLKGNGVWEGKYTSETFNINIPEGATLTLRHDDKNGNINLDCIILK